MMIPLPASERILLGPGPSMVSPRVMRTMAAPVLSHLDPDLMAMMDELRGRLDAAFKALDNTLVPLESEATTGENTVYALNRYQWSRLKEMALKNTDVQRTFSDTVLIMTSNLGSDEFKRFTKPLGFLVDSQHLATVKQAVLREAENHFSPEFLNRVDDIVVFSPLTEEEVREIARRYLGTIQKNLAAYGKSLEFTEEALKTLSEIGFSLKYGARFLKRRIDERIKLPLTLHWKEGNHFRAEVLAGELSVSWNS